MSPKHSTNIDAKAKRDRIREREQAVIKARKRLATIPSHEETEYKAALEDVKDTEQALLDERTPSLVITPC